MGLLPLFCSPPTTGSKKAKVLYVERLRNNSWTAAGEVFNVSHTKLTILMHQLAGSLVKVALPLFPGNCAFNMALSSVQYTSLKVSR